MGTMTDLEVAQKLKLPYTAVRQRRITLGIPSVLETRWTPDKIALLGTMSDRKLAMQLGFSRSAVIKRRTDLGIEIQDMRHQGKSHVKRPKGNA